MRFLPIRVYIVGCMLAVLLPMLGLLMYSMKTSLDFLRGQTAAQGTALARMAATSTDGFLDQFDRTLDDLSREPGIQSLDAKECGLILSLVSNDYGSLVLPALFDRSGKFVCGVGVSATGQTRDVAESAWFQAVVETRKAAYGSPADGSWRYAWSFVAARPIFETDGGIAGVLALDVDLRRFDRVLDSASLPRDMAIGIVAPDGTILTQFPGTETWIGRPIAPPESVRAIFESTSGSFEGDVFDGAPQILGIDTVQHTGWRVYVAVSQEAAISGLRDVFLRNALVVLIVVLSLVAMSVLLSRRITRPMSRLARVAMDAAAGKLDKQVPIGGTREVAAVGKALNTLIERRRQAEADLKDSEGYLRLILETLGEGVYVLDRSGVVMSNASVRKILGATIHEIQHRLAVDPGWALVNESGVVIAASEFPGLQALRTGKAHSSATVGLRNPDGDIRWLLGGAHPMYRNGEETPSSVVCSFIDITGRLQAEQALQQSEERFQQMFNASPLAISLRSTVNGRFLDANPTYLRVLGYARDEIVGRTFDELTIEVDLSLRPGFEAELRRTGRLTDVEIPLRTRDGAVIEVLASMALIGVEQSSAVLTMFSDVTERRRMECALRESEASASLLSLVASKTDNAVMINDEEGRIQWVNDAFARLTGYLPAEAVGQPAATFLISSDVAKAEQVRTRDMIASGVPFHFETRIRRKSGEIRSISVYHTWVKDDKTGVRRSIEVANDITERVRTQLELREANAKLVEWVSQLESRNRESALLTEFADLLQGCTNAEEAHEVIGQFAPLFLPGTEGSIGVIGASRIMVEQVVSWGRPLPGDQIFAPADCWALRRGRPHLIQSGSHGISCRHIHEAVTASFCVPMMAQGEALGALHVMSPDRDRLTPGVQQLVETIADHIALALSNLMLRESLRVQSIRDPLTGLFNRRYLEETFERERSRAVRLGGSLAVLMLDLDHFKRFNDEHGHGAGDILLKRLGAVLLANVRESDIACRYGGEEFIVIMVEATLDEGRLRAEQIREAVKLIDVEHNGMALGAVTVSIGVSAFPVNGMSSEALLLAADRALYASKAAGRDVVRTATELAKR